MTANLKFARPVAAAFGLVALLGVIPANAADLVVDDVPAAVPMEEPPLATWTGPYAGVTLGYGFAGEAQAPGNEIDTEGVLGGAFAGYNYQAGSGLVLGAEADLGYNGMDGSNAGVDIDGGVEGSLRARLGYAITPEILLYGTAGGAAQSVEASSGGVSDSQTLLGWTAGVGTDVAVTDNVFGRVEYRYTDLSDETFALGAGAADIDADNHRVTFGIGMKF